MHHPEVVDALVREFGLDEADVYLLDLVPLIEMMWADERSDPPELALVYEFAVKHLADLSGDADGLQVLSVAQVNHFLDRFAHRRPDPRMLSALGNLAVGAASADGRGSRGGQRRARILDYCMDIAAACSTGLDDPQRRRLVDAEKRLLRELLHALDIDEDAPAPI